MGSRRTRNCILQSSAVLNMKLHKCLTMRTVLHIVIQLIVTVSGLQIEPKHQFKKLSFQDSEMHNINCALHAARIKQRQLTVWATEMQCGLICGKFDNCKYFVVDEYDLNCLVCTTDPLQEFQVKDTFQTWPKQIDAMTNIWMKMYKYIGNDVRGGSILDTASAYTFVDTTPVPERLKIYSFLYNAGAKNRQIHFGIYRRYDDANACNFELIHQWTTVSQQLGLNEYTVSDYVVEKGDYIGFAWTQRGVILFHNGASPLYCSLNSATKVSGKYSFSTSYGTRVYAFLVKFTIF